MQTSYSTTDNNVEIIVLIIIWKTDPLLFSFSFFLTLINSVLTKKKKKNPILETVGWQKMKQPKHYNYCIGKYYANKYI